MTGRKRLALFIGALICLLALPLGGYTSITCGRLVFHFVGTIGAGLAAILGGVAGFVIFKQSVTSGIEPDNNGVFATKSLKFYLQATIIGLSFPWLIQGFVGLLLLITYLAHK